MRLSKQLAVSAVVVAVAAMFLTASFIPALNDNQAAGEQEAVQYFADPASNDKKSDAIWVVDKILHGLADKTGGMIFVKQAIPDDAVIIKGNSTIADGKITGQDGSVFNSGDNKALVFKNANVTSDGSKVIVNNRSVFFTGDNTFTGPSETALNLDINSDYNYANGVFVGGVGIVPAPAGDAGTTTIASSSFTLHSYKDIHPTSEETYIVEVELALAGDSYDDFFSISFSGEGVETNMEIHNDDGIEFDLNVTFHTEDLIDYIVSDTSTDNIKTSLVNYFVNNEFSDDFEFFFGLNNLELSDTTTIIEADGDYYKKTAETNYALFSGITAEIEPGEGSVQTALNAVSSKVQFLMHSEETDYYPDADCKEGEEIEGMSVYSLSELAVNGFVGTLAVTKDKGAYAELTVPNFDVTYVSQNGDVSTQAIMTVYNAGMKFWVDKVPQVQELSFSNILGTVMPFLLEGINGCIYCSYAEFQVIQNDGGDVSEYNGILGDQLSTDKYIDIDIKVKAQMQPDFTPALVDSGITLKTLGSPFLVVTEESTGLGVTFLDVSANIPLAINKEAEGMTDLIVIDPSARVLIGTYFVSETGGVVPFQLDGISIECTPEAFTSFASYLISEGATAIVGFTVDSVSKTEDISAAAIEEKVAAGEPMIIIATGATVNLPPEALSRLAKNEDGSFRNIAINVTVENTVSKEILDRLPADIAEKAIMAICINVTNCVYKDDLGTVTVTVPLPAGVSEDVVMAYVDPEGDTERLPTRIIAGADGSMVEFETDHFSDFVLLPSDFDDKKEDTTKILIIALAVSAVILVIGYFVAFYRRM